MTIVAIILILSSSVTLALFLIRKEIRHCRSLADVICVIEYICGRAEYFKEPLADILKNNISENKKMFRILCDNFENESLKTAVVPEVWESSVKNTCRGLLEDYEIDVLVHFGNELCRSSTFEIENLRKKTISALEDFRKTAVENKNMKSKTTTAITVSAGIMIILMIA